MFTRFKRWREARRARKERATEADGTRIDPYYGGIVGEPPPSTTYVGTIRRIGNQTIYAGPVRYSVEPSPGYMDDDPVVTAVWIGSAVADVMPSYVPAPSCDPSPSYDPGPSTDSCSSYDSGASSCDSSSGFDSSSSCSNSGSW